MAPDNADHHPALTPFLQLLEADLEARPTEAALDLPPALLAELQTLAEAIGPIDPDSPLEGDVAS